MFSASQQLLDQPDLVVGIEHSKGRLQVHELGVPSQDLDADGVEGAEPGHAFDHAADQLADPMLHLARRLVGEGDGEDFAGPRAAQAQNVGDAGGEHAGLAGAGAGKHEQGTVERLDRFALLGVERVEVMPWAPPHGTGRKRGLSSALVFVLGGRKRSLCRANLIHLKELYHPRSREKKGRSPV